MCVADIDKIQLQGSFKSLDASIVQQAIFEWEVREPIFEDPSQYYKLDGLGTLSFHQILFS